MTPRLQLRVATFSLGVVLAGCGAAPPKPWEKDLLAKPAMSMNSDSLENRFSQHIYSSKENSSGGGSFGGGGCGCN
jgi:hypothetical protein